MRLLFIMFSIAVAVAVAVPMASGKEFNVLGGIIERTGDAGGSYSGQMEYLDNPLRNLALSVSYLNEGHLRDTRRDGYMLQFWGYAPLEQGRFSLAAGAGPYYYFNTTNEGCGSYCNTHGIGAALSAAVGMKAAGGMLFHLRTNWIMTEEADTLSALVGVGYRFNSFTDAPEKRLFPVGKNQISLLAGQTTVNSFNSEHSLAFSLEYRRSIFENLDWTIGWLYEGETPVLRRSGFVSQLWAVQPLLAHSLSIGIGGGIYMAVDHYHQEKDSQALSGIAALTASYSFDKQWLIRSTWYRVITQYDGDTDVIMGGVGFRF